MNSQTKFFALVDSLASSGMSRQKATIQAARQNPALHTAMINESNGRRSQPRSGRRSTNAVAMWNDAVDSNVSIGLTRRQATAKAYRESPRLHAAMVAEANDQTLIEPTKGQQETLDEMENRSFIRRVEAAGLDPNEYHTLEQIEEAERKLKDQAELKKRTIISKAKRARWYRKD